MRGVEDGDDDDAAATFDTLTQGWFAGQQRAAEVRGGKGDARTDAVCLVFCLSVCLSPS